MIEEVFKKNDRVTVDSFEGLLVKYVATKKHAVVIRGIRTNSDFEYELGIAQANRHLSPSFETIFMMTDPQYSFLSSSINLCPNRVGIINGTIIHSIHR